MMLLVRQLLKKFATLAVFHDKVEIVRRLKRLIVLHDVRVIQRCQNINLLLEHIELIDQSLLLEGLDRHLEVRVGDARGQENFSKVAGTEDFLREFVLRSDSLIINRMSTKVALSRFNFQLRRGHI